jgi:hypothetical protein
MFKGLVVGSLIGALIFLSKPALIKKKEIRGK